MGSRLVQVMSWLVVVGAGAVAAAALVLVPPRVRLIVEADAAPTAEPIALLRDDLRIVREDVDALSKALAGNFEQLAQALDEAATRRHGEVREQLAGLGELRNNAIATAQRLQALEAAVAAVAGRLAATPPAAPADVAGTERTATASPTAVAAEPTTTAAADPAQPAPTPVPVADATPAPPPGESTAPAPAAKPSFLSFRLPNRTFAFDQEQQFEIVADLSRVGFDAKSTLHDFSGVTSKVQGWLRANLAAADGGWTGAVRCEANGLATGVEGRDTAMREHLDAEHHAEIAFAIAGFTPAPDGIDRARQTVRGEVRGQMTIRGVTKDLTMPVQLHVDDGKRLVIEGQATVRLPDYGVPVPSQLGLISMQEDVRIWIALRARLAPLAGGERGR